MRERIYCVGPMRGLPQNNFPAFDRAAAALRAKGHEVVSPAELDRERGFDGNGEPPARFLNEVFPDDVDVICRWATAIFVLPGWERSEFGRIEWQIAVGIGLKIFYSFDCVPDESSEEYSAAMAAEVA